MPYVLKKRSLEVCMGEGMERYLCRLRPGSNIVARSDKKKGNSEILFRATLGSMGLALTGPGGEKCAARVPMGGEPRC